MSVPSSGWNLYCTSVDAEDVYLGLVKKGRIFGQPAEFRVDGNCVYWRHFTPKRQVIKTQSKYLLDKKPGSLSGVESRQGPRFRIIKSVRDI